MWNVAAGVYMFFKSARALDRSKLPSALLSYDYHLECRSQISTNVLHGGR